MFGWDTRMFVPQWRLVTPSLGAQRRLGDLSGLPFQKWSHLKESLGRRAPSVHQAPSAFLSLVLLAIPLVHEGCEFAPGENNYRRSDLERPFASPKRNTSKSRDIHDNHEWHSIALLVSTVLPRGEKAFAYCRRHIRVRVSVNAARRRMSIDQTFSIRRDDCGATNKGAISLDAMQEPHDETKS